jgi:hypothetical protein
MPIRDIQGVKRADRAAGRAESVITDLHAHSLGVLAVGLGLLADVTRSATLNWRFRAEADRPGLSAA